MRVIFLLQASIALSFFLLIGSKKHPESALQAVHQVCFSGLGWVLLKDQQSCHSALPSGRHQPGRTAILQGHVVHPGQHGTAPYHRQISFYLWQNLSTDT